MDDQIDISKYIEDVFDLDIEPLNKVKNKIKNILKTKIDINF